MNSACYDCRYWSPGECGSCHEESSSLPKVWREDSMEGECRCHPPSLGDLIRDSHDEEFRFFGQWPKTMACDWCGRFEQRSQPPIEQPETPQQSP